MLFIIINKVVLTLSSVDDILPVVLFLMPYKVVLTFESVDEIVLPLT